MSLATSRRVWSTTPDTIRGGAFTILLALADYANEHNLCWPTLRQLADKARIEERQATTLVRKLERDGQIAVARKAGRGGGMLFAILTGLDREQKVQCLHLFNAQKVQFTALKGAICAEEKVQSVQTPETAFDAPLSAETPLDAQCNDHKKRSVTKTTPNGVAPAAETAPPQQPARNPSPPVALPPSPQLATATPTPASAGQVPAEIEQPRLVDAEMPDPVDTYRDVCKVKRPNQVQRETIRKAVTGYGDEWRKVCEQWMLNGWNVRHLGNMLDAYQKLVTERRKVEARQAEAERQRREAPPRDRPATDEEVREIFARFWAFKESAPSAAAW
jgi:hypothetical protein